ncbi:MAG: hypothetical protein GY842_07105 [bacterium]|nr:hypothetical protein [bacterium]
MRIAEQLRSLLAGQDTDLATDGLLNRKRTADHSDDLDVLIRNVAIVMQYLRMDAAASRREAFALQRILDRDDGGPEWPSSD